MEKWLFDILKDGTLVDNQSYRITKEKESDCWLGIGVSLLNRGYNQRKKIWNDNDAIWKALNEVSKEKIKRKLITFNDEEYKHNTSDRFLWVNGTDVQNFTIKTGNVIGFLKKRGYEFKIDSRFGNNFLKYIIADADGFLEKEHSGAEEESTNGYEWLLAYIWNTKFKRAYRLGLPKVYVTKNERMTRVRGKIDVIDYFQNKMTGKYLCSYREHSFESPMLSLIIKAYESLWEKYSFCKETRNIYKDFLMANQGIKRSHQEMLQTKHFTNPFYSDYNPLIDLSKRVISKKSSSFGSQNEASAFLFDVSMLFEYFIRKLLKREGISLHRKQKEYSIPKIGKKKEHHGLEPDLVFENEEGLYVFDVKYKKFDFNKGVKREDLFQLHTYVGQWGNSAPIKGCGFIYPLLSDAGDGQSIRSTVFRQQGREIPFHVLFLKIPRDESGFHEAMSEQCDIFVKTVRSLLNSE